MDDFEGLKTSAEEVTALMEIRQLGFEAELDDMTAVL